MISVIVLQPLFGALVGLCVKGGFSNCESVRIGSIKNDSFRLRFKLSCVDLSLSGAKNEVPTFNS